MLLGATFKLH